MKLNKLINWIAIAFNAYPILRHKTNLTFIAKENNCSVKLIKIGDPHKIDIKYQVNNDNWKTYDFNNDTIQLNNINDSVQFKSTTTNFSKDIYNFYRFYTEGEIEIIGDANSLINYGNLTDYCFYCLFAGCSNIIVENLFLISEQLSDFCYANMFYKCYNLTTLPILYTKKLSLGCYQAMFCQCTSLINVPSLPLQEIADRCYFNMFSGCSSIKQTPKLPAKNLASACYAFMFYGCNQLKKINQISAKNVQQLCFFGMFGQCLKLENATNLYATTMAQSCYSQMFAGCTSLIKSPQLPASSLKEGCYNNMFNGCINLKEITANFKNWEQNCTQNWVQNVNENGTFTCRDQLNQIRGNSNIPNNWAINTYSVLVFNKKTSYEENMLQLKSNNYSYNENDKQLELNL